LTKKKKHGGEVSTSESDQFFSPEPVSYTAGESKKLTKKHRMNSSKLEKHKKKSEEEPDESIKLTDTNDVVSFSEGDFKKKTRPEVLQ